MQVNLAVGQPRIPNVSRRFSGLRDSSMRLPAALIITTVLVFSLFSNPCYCTESPSSSFQNLFHLVGIPGLRRDERVNLAANSDGFLFQTKKTQYDVPYARIRQVILLRADRRYEGRTYAAAVATYGVGSLLILKKHHVDTVVLDYLNERGGKMGIVIQMETAQGEQFSSLLKSRGVPVVEPDDLQESTLKDETGNDLTKRSNQ